MGETLEELRRKRDRALAEAESRTEMQEIGRKRKVLRKQIKRLQSPRRVAFKKTLGKSSRLIGKGIVVGTKRAIPYVQKAGQRIAEVERRERLRQKPMAARKPLRRVKKKKMRKVARRMTTTEFATLPRSAAELPRF